MNVAQGALWLKIIENARDFTFKFNIDVNIVNKANKFTAEFVPVTLDSTNDLAIREIEHRSNLNKYSISTIEWIKLVNCYKPDQKVAFVTIQINTSKDTNKVIFNGLIIEGKRVFLNKVQLNPSRCYNCQTYPKLFHLAKDCPNNCRYGTCSEEHPDHNTYDYPVSNLVDQFCISYDMKGHLS